MMEYSEMKDISLRCNACKKHYALSSVLDHQKHHRAMRILRFKDGKGPKNLESLSKRHLMIETLRYEFTKDNFYLKSMLIQEGITSMRDGYFEPRDKTAGDFVSCDSVLTYKESEYPSCVAGIGLSQALNKEWRDTVDSRTLVTTDVATLCTSGGTSFVGLFDGNHGSSAAQSSMENFHKILSKEINSSKSKMTDSPDPGFTPGTLFMADDCDNLPQSRSLADSQVSKCLSNSYKRMDEFLGHGINEKSKLRWSGCSAVTCLITNKHENVQEQNVTLRNLGSDYERSSSSQEETAKNKLEGKIFIANAGDVQAVFYHKKKPFMLTEKHSLENMKERNRVLAAGGEITDSDRHAKIYGIHKTTRGLGNHGDPNLRKCVTPLPHVSMAKVTKDSQMIVMATSSLWEVFSPQDVLTILQHTHSHSLGQGGGPTPIIPIMHDAFRGGRSDGSDGFQNNAGKSSTLPSILETEEEEIEEVIFVEGQPEDSDSEEDSQDLSKNLADKSSSSKKTATEASDVADLSDTDFARSSTGKLPNESCTIVTQDQKMKLKYANIAKEMSEQLVRAAVAAGVMDNISVIVVLFTGAIS